MSLPGNYDRHRAFLCEKHVLINVIMEFVVPMYVVRITT